MHGSTQYTNLASDLAGYDMQHARGGVKKHALYVGASDHIPCDYNAGMPKGTAMIGLLLTKKTVGHGAYEQYHLSANAYANPLPSGVRRAQRRHRRP